MNTEEKNPKKKDTVEDRVDSVLRASMMLEMFLNAFIEFTQHKDYEQTLAPLAEKFVELIKLRCDFDDESQIKMQHVVDNGVMFLLSAESISVSELVNMGAKLTPKEYAKLREEILDKFQHPAQREKLAPYMATPMYYMVTRALKEDQKFIVRFEELLKELKKTIAAQLMMNETESASDKYRRAKELIQKLKEKNIVVNADGIVEDPDGYLEKEKQMFNGEYKGEHRRGSSESGT